MFEQEILNNYAPQILNVKYNQIDTNRVATNQKHLNVYQLHNLQLVLAKYGKRFEGSLGVYPH